MYIGRIVMPMTLPVVAQHVRSQLEGDAVTSVVRPILGSVDHSAAVRDKSSARSNVFQWVLALPFASS